MTVQQAFVRVAPNDDNAEAIYVAEPDSSKTYKVELVSIEILCLFFSFTLYAAYIKVGGRRKPSIKNLHSSFAAYFLETLHIHYYMCWSCVLLPEQGNDNI